MTWLIDDQITFVWTAVPSGIITSGPDQFLRLHLVVAPRMTEAQSQPGGIGHFLFSDWPARLHGGFDVPVLPQFNVIFLDESTTGTRVPFPDVPVRLTEVCEPGVWPKVFPRTEIKARNAAPPAPLPVNEIADSYDAGQIDEQLRIRRGYNGLLNAMDPNLADEKVYAMAWKYRAYVSMHESLSLLSRDRLPAEQQWSQMPLVSLVTEIDPDDRKVIRVPREQLERLQERNLHRASAAPDRLLRPDVAMRIRWLTRRGMGRRPPDDTYDVNPDAFLQLSMFHARAKELPTTEEPTIDRKLDFAERATLVRGFPTYAKKLGLLLELRVPVSPDQLSLLSTGRWRVWAEPQWQGPVVGQVRNLSPSTWCTVSWKVAEPTKSRFSTSEVKSDGITADPEHRNGHLILNGPDTTWRLTAADVDGAGLATVNLANSTASRLSPEFMTDASGRILVANWSAEQLLENGGGVVGRRIFDLATVDGDKSLKTLMRELVDAGLPQRSISPVLHFKHGGIGGRPAQGQVTAVLKMNVDRTSVWCEWKMPLEGDSPKAHNDAVSVAHRTVGLSLIRRDSGEQMGATAQRSDELAAAPAAPGEPRLTAADLILGYVPEVWAPPAADNSGAGQWYSTTSRYEQYVALGDHWREAEGFIDLGLPVVNDAAPAHQANPVPQGSASPAMVVYANDSLGVTSKRQSWEMEEEPTGDPQLPPEEEIVKTMPRHGVLPLIRYSHLSVDQFSYALRCRYIDLAGNSDQHERHSRGEESLWLEDLVTREEPVAPPRVLTYGALDLRKNPGSGLKLLVTREDERPDQRCLIPPKVAPDMALRYGLVLGSLRQKGSGFAAIELTEVAEVPEEPIILVDGSHNDETTTPVARHSGKRPGDGFYYLPDPAAQGVLVTLRTFYSDAFDLPPLTANVPYYSGHQWPNAKPICLRLCRLPLGDIHPQLGVSGLTVTVALPPGWTGTVGVSSAFCDRSTFLGDASHFTAWRDFTKAADAELRIAEWYETGNAALVKDIPRTRRIPRASSLHETAAQAMGRVAQGKAFRSMYGQSKADLSRRIEEGYNAAFSPPESISVVSATQRPLCAPSLSINPRSRRFDDDSIDLDLESMADEKSTSELTVYAEWDRLADDPGSERPETVHDRVEVSKLKLLPPVTFEPTRSKWTSRLNLGTAGYRKVTYSLSSVSRFAEFYPTMGVADLSRDGANQLTIEHPNVTRPNRPAPRFLVPTLTWTSCAHPLQNEPRSQFVSRSRYGIRVYLERGWNLGEMLGVVTLPTLDEFQNAGLNHRKRRVVDPLGQPPLALNDSITQWGVDPLVDSDLIKDLPEVTDFQDYQRVGGDLLLPPLSDDLASDPARRVSVVGFEPQWNDKRKLWFCDIGLSSIPSYGCFVRLLLTRYQPNSVENFELSAPVRADFIQVRPDRIVTVLRDPDDPKGLSLKVLISEPIEEGRTALEGSALEGFMANRFSVHVEMACETRNGTPVGWMRDPSIDSQHTPASGGGLLWTATLRWSQHTGSRRIVIREFEMWPESHSGEREIWSHVLEV